METLRNTYYLSPPKRKILGDKNTGGDSPISPTANLKLLTKVASQFDSLENRSLIFNNTDSAWSNVNRTVETPPALKTTSGLSYISGIHQEVALQVKYTRKFKSLGFLCDKFLKLFPLDMTEGRQMEICLTEVACHLGVEKRRIYDIINVVESLKMAIKVGKNTYAWFGNQNLTNVLTTLRAYAIHFGLHQYVQFEQNKRRLFVDNEGNEERQYQEIPLNGNLLTTFRNERRIGLLCRKFIMLFIVSHDKGLINLDMAASILVGDSAPQQNKTRLRRLYDIANILVSLGIIRKLDTHSLPENVSFKKPVFSYAGPSLQHLDMPFTNQSEHVPYNWDNILDFSDVQNSDMSEDSVDISTDSILTTQADEGILEAAATVKLHHSYSMENSPQPGKNSFSLTSQDQPAAKKRLVFSTQRTEIPLVSKKSEIGFIKAPTNSFRLKPSCKIVTTDNRDNIRKRSALDSIGNIAEKASVVRLVNVYEQSSSLLQDGGLYKAIKVGNDIQLIKIDGVENIL